MRKPINLLEVEIRQLPELQVVHKLILFRSNTGNPDGIIRPAFQELREQIMGYGLNPDTLLHVGIPELVDSQLTSYDCCIEFPLPENLENMKTLLGGCYAVLSIEKIPAKIKSAIHAFIGDYLPDHSLLLDEDRPIYEFYFKETMEYCLPIR
jgi:DNA gyrase inhibitor GyrI